jgi:hypothetical protein
LAERRDACDALTDGLRAWAAAHGTDVDAARWRVVYERLLARMDAAAPLRWVVRGGRAIDLRLEGKARRGYDLDVCLADAEPGPLEQLRRTLIAICQTDLADGWDFTLTRLQRSLVQGIGVVGFKAYVAAAHDGVAMGDFPVDVSRATAPGATEVLSVPAMLNGPRLRVVAVRPEVLIAEKVHAFTRPYPAGKPRPRSHDLVDAVALVLGCELDLELLRATAEQTFSDRATHAIPGALPEPPPEWASAFQVHGEGYRLANLPTAQGAAILSAVWSRAMPAPAAARQAGDGGRRAR